MGNEGDDDTSHGWCTWNNPLRIVKGTGRLRNKKTSKDYQDFCFFKIGQNTEKSPGDLRGLAVIQSPVRNYQLTLVRKTLKYVNNNPL